MCIFFVLFLRQRNLIINQKKIKKMDLKKILVTVAISAATCILLDFVLPMKLDEEKGKFTRLNF